MTYDLVLAGNPPTAHTLDCPAVEVLRTFGQPILTMLECANPLPDDTPRHTCLEDTP